MLPHAAPIKVTGPSYPALPPDELVKALNTIIDSEKKGTMPTMGKEGELTLAHFIGVPLDGSYTLVVGGGKEEACPPSSA